MHSRAMLKQMTFKGMISMIDSIFTPAERTLDDLGALDIIASEFEWQYYSISHNQPVYHYTSPEGLLGILKDKGINLRFTRYDCVNDLSEGKDVIHCYELACQESLKDGNISLEFYEAIKEIDINSRSIPAKTEAYICCFSRDGDSLPMWNYYSKKGINQGYNVGFNFGLTDHSYIAIENELIQIEMVSIIYNDNEKIRDIKNIIDSVHRLSGSDPGYRNCRFIIIDELKKRMFRFKSQFFSHEQELRLVLHVPVELSEDYCEEKRIKIKYTSQNGYLIPYVDVVYKKEILNHITIGPLLEKEISIRTLETIKRNYKYRYDIITSNVPIRF